MLLLGLAGAGISAIGSVIGNKAKRQATVDEATYNKTLLQQQYDESIATADKELAVSKENDLNTFGSTMTQTYLDQLSAESEYVDAKQQGAETVGSLNAGMAQSGIRKDTTLGDVVSKQITSKLAEQRTAIDRGLSLTVDTAKTSLVDKYQEGSSYMDLFNFKKTSLTDQYTTKKNYLQKMIDDNTETNGNFFWSDILGGSSGILSGLGTAASGAHTLGWLK